MNIEVGKVYRVNHCRKGKFNFLVTGIHGEWIDGEIVEGEAKLMSRGGNARAGDAISFRESFASFEEIK